MQTNTSGYRYKQNRFQQLRGFCYAAASSSVSKAAQRMHLSQPAVSQQIQSLENELAVTLFVRRGSKIQLTHEGELLFEMASTLIEQLEHLDEQFRLRRSDVDEGHIEVAAGMSTILYFLPKHVEQFHRAHPKIEVRLHNVTGLEGLEQLRTGLVDFAVGPLMSVPEDLEFHPVVSYEPVVITCLGHPLAHKPLSLKEISRYPLILPPRGLSTWNLVDSTFKKHGLHRCLLVGFYGARGCHGFYRDNAPTVLALRADYFAWFPFYSTSCPGTVPIRGGFGRGGAGQFPAFPAAVWSLPG